MSRKAPRQANSRTPRFEKRNTRKDNNVIEPVEFNSVRPRKKTKVELVPRNLNQETLLSYLHDQSKDIVVAVGPAGTGKSYMATLWAIEALRAGVVDKVVISRPNMAADDIDIGYLPGDVNEKMTPWLLPILDIFKEFYHPREVEAMMVDGVIEAVPIAHIRGRTFKNACILIDEAQNTTPVSMKAILTRIGENSKMVVTGDIGQTDHKEVNGLADFLSKYNPERTTRIAMVKFDRKDVERHPVVGEILSLYGEE